MVRSGSSQPDVFASLRRDDSRPAGGGTFVGVLEVQRFAPLRRSIGYALANELMLTLAARLTGPLKSLRLWPTRTVRRGRRRRPGAPTPQRGSELPAFRRSGWTSDQALSPDGTVAPLLGVGPAVPSA